LAGLTSAIVLAGGLSKRFGSEKPFVLFDSKPLICHVVNAVIKLADEIIVVCGNFEQSAKLFKVLQGSATILVDDLGLKAPIAGAFTGFKRAKGLTSLLLACDIPLLSSKVLSILLKASSSYDAVIPMWPNGQIEPLVAAYKTDGMQRAVKEAINNNELRIYDAIKRLTNVYYISTEIIRCVDPYLDSFRNINTPEDLGFVKEIISLRYGKSQV
jgi:molybdopterin-guanine dinucleotide biosynthesis protein A